MSVRHDPTKTRQLCVNTQNMRGRPGPVRNAPERTRGPETGDNGGGVRLCLHLSLRAAGLCDLGCTVATSKADVAKPKRAALDMHHTSSRYVCAMLGWLGHKVKPTSAVMRTLAHCMMKSAGTSTSARPPATGSAGSLTPGRGPETGSMSAHHPTYLAE